MTATHAASIRVNPIQDVFTKRSLAMMTTNVHPIHATSRPVPALIQPPFAAMMMHARPILVIQQTVAATKPWSVTPARVAPKMSIVNPM